MKTLSTVRNRYLTRVATVAGLIMGLAVNVSWAGVIAGSAHDFTRATVNFTGGQICVACHTPHGGNTTVTDAPLWSHTLSSVTNYTLYSSGTLNAGSLAQPSGVSKLCLSCHDGTVALDSYIGGAGTFGPLTGAKAIASTAQGSLGNDHPIGFTYDTALATADGALHDPATRSVTIGAGGTRSKTGTVASTMLFNGRLECASCHDVHNTFTAADGIGVGAPLLRVSKGGSALCLTCHNK
jgi:Doubled CXXCH motif (Paired_CXXCH_1)